jgi:hypothetical protein
MDRNAEMAKDGEQMVLMTAGGFADRKRKVAQENGLR